MSPPGSGQLSVGDSVCCAAMFHPVTAAWASSTVFPRPEHSLAFMCGCNLLFDFFLFVQSLSRNFYASFNWLSMSKAQVGNDCG